MRRRSAQIRASSFAGTRAALVFGRLERRPRRHLPCLWIGRHIRFTRSILEEWLQGRVA